MTWRSPILYQVTRRATLILLTLAVAAVQSAPIWAAEKTQGPQLELGRKVYGVHCAECHGDNGDGYGLRQDITYARPRSFHLGRFKLATTDNRVPSDADLIRTISRGVALVGMPNFGHLPDDEIAAVARYVRGIGVEATREQLAGEVASGRLTARQAAELMVARTVPGRTIEVPPEPPWTPERRERGRQLYLDSCAPCHGLEGAAPPGSAKPDLEGNLLLPTSLKEGLFKGGAEGEQLYARILKGLDGTAMPGYEGALDAAALWDVVHYVQSLSRPVGWEPAGGLETGESPSASVHAATVEANAWEDQRGVHIAEYEQLFSAESSQVEVDDEAATADSDPFAGWPEGTTWEEAPRRDRSQALRGLLLYGLLLLGLGAIALVAWLRASLR